MRAAANSAFWRAFMARLRAGVRMMYSTKPRGNAPYSAKVMMAPSTVPVLLVASTTAISSVTYSQAIATIYI